MVPLNVGLSKLSDSRTFTSMPNLRKLMVYLDLVVIGFSNIMNKNSYNESHIPQLNLRNALITQITNTDRDTEAEKTGPCLIIV